MRSDFEILETTDPEAVDGGERCRVRVRIPEDVKYVEGHFEHEPIVPGVAQLLPLVYAPARQAWPDLGAATSLRRLKFKSALRPGESIEVELTRQADKVRFQIRRGETLCTRGAITFGPVPSG